MLMFNFLVFISRCRYCVDIITYVIRLCSVPTCICVFGNKSYHEDFVLYSVLFKFILNTIVCIYSLLLRYTINGHHTHFKSQFPTAHQEKSDQLHTNYVYFPEDLVRKILFWVMRMQQTFYSCTKTKKPKISVCS